MQTGSFKGGRIFARTVYWKTCMSPSAHTVDVYEDLVAVRIDGSLSLSESQRIYHSCALVLAERGYVLMLFELSGAALPSSDSRKWISNWFKHRNVGRIAVATFGTSLLVRTVNRMFDSAIFFLSGHAAPGRHFSTAAEALAWLVERRRALHNK